MAYRAVTVRDKTYWTFTLAVRLPGPGKVRLVVSFKSAELTGTYVVLVTNRVDWDAQRIITLYLQRWPIETFYQDGKRIWAWTSIACVTHAIGKHWCLVFVAYSLLHLDCLLPSLMQGSLPIKTIRRVVSKPKPYAGVDPLCARTTPTRTEGRRPLRLSVCQATNGCGEMSVCLVLTKSQQASQ